jgi:hypothetical protein
MGHSYTVERAYARGDAPQEARGDYAELGEFLPRPADGGKVVPMQRGAV